jgi:hypothetical protein
VLALLPAAPEPGWPVQKNRLVPSLRLTQWKLGGHSVSRPAPVHEMKQPATVLIQPRGPQPRDWAPSHCPATQVELPFGHVVAAGHDVALLQGTKQAPEVVVRPPSCEHGVVNQSSAGLAGPPDRPAAPPPLPPPPSASPTQLPSAAHTRPGSQSSSDSQSVEAIRHDPVAPSTSAAAAAMTILRIAIFPLRIALSARSW